MIWDQFQWGVPLEASLFKPEIPADYEVMDDDPVQATGYDAENHSGEAFAQQTQAEPYLGDFDHLPLPDVNGLSLLGTDPTAPRPQVRLLGAGGDSADPGCLRREVAAVRAGERPIASGTPGQARTSTQWT